MTRRSFAVPAAFIAAIVVMAAPVWLALRSPDAVRRVNDYSATVDLDSFDIVTEAERRNCFTGPAEVVAVDVNDGTEAWRTEIPWPATSTDDYPVATASADQITVVNRASCQPPGLVAVSTGGIARWQATLPGSLREIAVTPAGTVAAITLENNDRRLVIVDGDGAIVAEQAMDTDVRGIVAHGGLAVVHYRTPKHVDIFDVASGRRVHRIELPSRVRRIDLVDDRLFISLTDGGIAVYTIDGAAIGEAPTDARTNEIALGVNTVVALMTDGSLAVFDRSGKYRQGVAPTPRVISIVHVADDTVVYFGGGERTREVGLMGLSDGAVVWRAVTKAGRHVAASDDRVAVLGLGRSGVTIHDRATGDTLATIVNGEEFPFNPVFTFAGDAMVTIDRTTVDTSVVRLVTDEVAWTVALPGRIDEVPSLQPGLLIIETQADGVFSAVALDAATGEVRWTIQLVRPIAQVLREGDRLYLVVASPLLMRG